MYIQGLTMKPEAKANWIAALRSGEYKQGQFCLAHETGKGMAYCCLGVFAMVQTVGHLADPEDPTKYRFYFNGRPPHLTMLNYEWFSKFFNFDVEDETMKANAIASLAGKFANMNDVDKMSFNEIADWVETNL